MVFENGYRIVSFACYVFVQVLDAIVVLMHVLSVVVLMNVLTVISKTLALNSERLTCNLSALKN